MSSVVSESRPVGRHFGLTWFLVSTDYGDEGEVEFSALETSALGGQYFLQHDSEDGSWFCFEAGGVGDQVWDYAVCDGSFEFPLEGMRALARYDREQRRLFAVHEAALRSSGEIRT